MKLVFGILAAVLVVMSGGVQSLLFGGNSRRGGVWSQWYAKGGLTLDIIAELNAAVQAAALTEVKLQAILGLDASVVAEIFADVDLNLNGLIDWEELADLDLWLAGDVHSLLDLNVLLSIGGDVNLSDEIDYCRWKKSFTRKLKKWNNMKGKWMRKWNRKFEKEMKKATN